MPRPKASPNAYRDVIPMLDAALNHGGARFECGTIENAIKTVQRMNQYRLLTRRMNFEQHKAAGPKHNQTREQWDFEIQNMDWHVSAYDDLIIRRPIGSTIFIDKKPDRPFIEAYDIEGNRIDIDLPTGNPATPWIEPGITTPKFEGRPTVPGGTTRAPREKFDPTKPLGLMGDEE